jgi:hypothetical protein
MQAIGWKKSELSAHSEASWTSIALDSTYLHFLGHIMERKGFKSPQSYESVDVVQKGSFVVYLVLCITPKLVWNNSGKDRTAKC